MFRSDPGTTRFREERRLMRDLIAHVLLALASKIGSREWHRWLVDACLEVDRQSPDSGERS